MGGLTSSRRDVEFAEDLSTNPKIAAETQTNLPPLDHKQEENRRFVEIEYNLSPEEEKIEQTDDQEEDFRGFDRNPLDNEAENVAEEQILSLKQKENQHDRKGADPRLRWKTRTLELVSEQDYGAVLYRKRMYLQFQKKTNRLKMKSLPSCLKYR